MSDVSVVPARLQWHGGDDIVSMRHGKATARLLHPVWSGFSIGLDYRGGTLTQLTTLSKMLLVMWRLGGQCTVGCFTGQIRDSA